MSELLDVNEMLQMHFEPKTQGRFILTIDGVPAFLIKSAGRPQVEQEEIEIPFLNVRRYIKGFTTWSTMDMTLYDPIVPSAAQAIMEWLRSAHETATGRDGYSDMYKKNITIDVLGPVGDKVEKWTLKGAWPTSIDFGSLEWGTSDPQEISVTIRYDAAILSY